MPMPVAAAPRTADETMSIVVRLPQKRVTYSTSPFPAIVDSATSAEIIPLTHTASRPSSSRKYGCHA